MKSRSALVLVALIEALVCCEGGGPPGKPTLTPCPLGQNCQPKGHCPVVCPRGPKGYPGRKGETGDPGNPGTAVYGGRKGDAGNKGIPGVKGDNGAPGIEGRRGIKGDPGPQGPPGRNGASSTNGRKPFINLDGKQHLNQFLRPNTDLDIWSDTSNNGHVFNMTYSKGKITVQVRGLYFMFAQLYYNPPTTSARYYIKVNGNTVAVAHGTVGGARPQTIYTSALRYLNVGDKLSVQIAYWTTNVWVGPRHSFFGAFMI